MDRPQPNLTLHVSRTELFFLKPDPGVFRIGWVLEYKGEAITEVVPIPDPSADVLYERTVEGEWEWDASIWDDDVLVWEVCKGLETSGGFFRIAGPLDATDAAVRP